MLGEIFIHFSQKRAQNVYTQIEIYDTVLGKESMKKPNGHIERFIKYILLI